MHKCHTSNTDCVPRHLGTSLLSRIASVLTLRHASSSRGRQGSSGGSESMSFDEFREVRETLALKTDPDDCGPSRAPRQRSRCSASAGGHALRIHAARAGAGARGVRVLRCAVALPLSQAQAAGEHRPATQRPPRARSRLACITHALAEQLRSMNDCAAINDDARHRSSSQARSRPRARGSSIPACTARSGGPSEPVRPRQRAGEPESKEQRGEGRR
jgi:hypothetical protein